MGSDYVYALLTDSSGGGALQLAIVGSKCWTPEACYGVIPLLLFFFFCPSALWSAMFMRSAHQNMGADVSKFPDGIPFGNTAGVEIGNRHMPENVTKC